MLLAAPMPLRSEVQRERVRMQLLTPGSHWTRALLKGGEGRALEVWRLHRPSSRGVVVFLHGFGDDAWGTLGRAAELPDWDAVAVVERLVASGTPRSQILLAGWSQGAGVALLALADLEKTGPPLAGALLECPYEDIHEAAKNHLRLVLGPAELLARPAEWVALRRAGRLAGFDPATVSPVRASEGLRTPIALITGNADPETPVEGVRRMARHHPDFTVVPGAGHCQASGRLPGGWKAWAEDRLAVWIRTAEIKRP
jgi:pimeloyl-ACP methyl ester carboxylesterase